MNSLLEINKANTKWNNGKRPLFSRKSQKDVFFEIILVILMVLICFINFIPCMVYIGNIFQ